MRTAYDYAIIRVVPRVERGEFANVGIVLAGKHGSVLLARIEASTTKLRALDAALDLDSVRRHLDAFAAICAGGEAAGAIGRLSARERFHWLTAPRSTMIQTSPVHGGRCDDIDTAIEHLLDAMVR